MISRLLYRCPVCAGFDWLEKNGCVHCGASFKMEQQSVLAVNGRRAPVAHWYDRILAFDLPTGPNGLIYRSGRVNLSRETARGRYAGPGGLSAVLYGRQFVGTISVALFRDRIEFTGEDGVWTIPFESLLSVTIESNVIIIVDRVRGPLFLDFIEEPGKKWEDGIRRALAGWRAPETIEEFFPRILPASRLRDRTPAVSDGKPLKVSDGIPDTRGTHPAYVAVRLLVKTLVARGLRVNWSGMEHLPRRGAAILLCNHSSFMDSILLEALTPRNIWFMAKNSQYKGRLMTWFLGLARSFPVRRYTVDVQAVRNAVRVVRNGHILGIFPEGERNWDDRMLPFKRGTMRLVLALGVPVIPVGLSGAYGLMPRWTHRVKRVPVHIRFGAPVSINPVPPAHQTEADIAAITAKLRGKIQALSTHRSLNRLFP